MPLITEELAALTLDHYRTEVTEQIFFGTPFSAHLMMKDKVKFKGGHELAIPIQYQDSNTVKSFTGSGTLATSGRRQYDNSVWPWREFAGSVFYNQNEVSVNGGPERVVDLIQQRIKDLKTEIGQYIETMLLGAPGTTGDAQYKLSGLKQIVGTQNNTVGGINSGASGGANDWWDPQALSKTSATSTAARDYMDAIVKISRGGTDYPTLILSRPKHFVSLSNSMQDAQRYQNAEMADAGFPHLGVWGVPYIYADDDIANAATIGEAEVYFLNENYLYLYCHEDNWMKFHDFMRQEDQLVWAAHVSSMGQFACTRRKSQLLMTYGTSTS